MGVKDPEFGFSTMERNLMDEIDVQGEKARPPVISSRPPPKSIEQL